MCVYRVLCVQSAAVVPEAENRKGERRNLVFFGVPLLRLLIRRPCFEFSLLWVDWHLSKTFFLVSLSLLFALWFHNGGLLRTTERDRQWHRTLAISEPPPIIPLCFLLVPSTTQCPFIVVFCCSAFFAHSNVLSALCFL